MIRVFPMACLVFVLLTSMSGGEGNSDDLSDKIIGKWVVTQVKGMTVERENSWVDIKPGGKLVTSSLGKEFTGTWTLSGRELKMKAGDLLFTFDILSLDGDRMEVNDRGPDVKSVLERR